MRIVSVNIGLPREIQWRGKTVWTSIFKVPVTGPVRVERLNVDGDQQSDLTVHGGVDKAVYDTSKAIKDGTFKAGDNSFNATNDGVGYGKLDAVVPADAKAAADKALADIKSGAIKPKTDLTVKP